MDSRDYEVRCEYCQTSFAPGTRRCIHCGRPIGGGLLGALSAGELGQEGVRQTARRPHSESDEEERLHAARRGRNVLWVAMLILAMVGSALQHCQ